MPLSAARAHQVQIAADAWARRSGFADAGAVPFAHAPTLIAEVAAETQVSVAEVQEALLAAASAGNERSRKALDATGAAGAYRGASVHTPLENERGTRPMAALIAHRSAEGDPVGAAVAAKHGKDTDAVFRQTVEDFVSTRVVMTRKATPKTVGEVTDACAKLLKLFDELDGSRNDRQVKQEIIKTYKSLLSSTARRKGVFLTKSTAEQPLPSFLRTENDPTVPDSPGRVRRDDLGRGANIAFDPNSGTPFVYDHGGEVTELASIGEFVLRRKEQLETDVEAEALAGDVDTLSELRSFTDKEVDRLSGKTEYVSLLEDDDTGLCRVHATKWGKDSGDMLSRRVIVEGPFTGIFLDDLVNAIAQRREAGCDYEPRKGMLPMRPVNGEPFVTTTKIRERGQVRERLMVRIPENREWTQVRRSLRRLTELDPTIKYKKGTGNTSFVFGPDHYKLIRDIIKGTVVSGAARDLLQGHFDALTRIETVTEDKNLVHFTPDKIGGFKEVLEGPDGRKRNLEFTYWQKRSIAWLASNEYKGVIALGTGMGKTLVALGALQHLKKEKDETRPILVVGPAGLGGNMAAEAFKFLQKDEASELVGRMRFMDFSEFSKAVRSGKDADGNQFSSEQFGALVIDEAHKIANRNTVAGAAALAFKHDHKIIMTASAMTRGIDETMTLIAMSTNKNLNDRTEGKDERWRMRKFTNLHLRIVGGRAVGVTEAVELQPGEKVDPKHNMHSFIRANVLYADKRMDEYKLPEFRQSVETLTMPAAMEEQYREKSKSIRKILRGMVSLYRDQGVRREYVDDKGRTRREIEPLAKDKRIAEMFGRKLRSTIIEMNEITNDAAKLDRSADVVRKHLHETPSSRSILFSDSPEYVMESARTMSRKIPGKLHAACLGKEIHVYQNGKRLKELDGQKLPFIKRENVGADGRKYDANQWHKYVLDEVVGPNPDFATTTLFAPIYQEGQNLQWADVGIHLDRDTWSRQNMEQREGRIWRKGQEKAVSFYHLDWVYKKPEDHLDRTLDEVRALYDDVNAKLFHDVIVVPQDLELGGEWEGVRKQDDLRIDADVLSFAVAPDIQNAAEIGGWQ